MDFLGDNRVKDKIYLVWRMTLFCFQTVHLTGLTSVSLAKLLLNYFFSALLPPDSDQKMIPLAACRLVHFFTLS